MKKQKGMSGKDYFSLAFGSMIGIGWAVSVPLWISNAGTVGAIIAMVATALIVIPIGFVYSELCTSVKVSGGEFAYTYKYLGRIPGFISGWFLVLGYLTILPWVALSVSSLFSYVFPALQSAPLYTVLGYTMYLPETIIGLVMIWALTLLNLKGVEASKTFQNIATTMMLITFVIFFGGCLIKGDVQNLKPYFNSEMGAGKGILAAIASMLFFMNGFDTIPKAADEADKNINYKNLAKALVGTILFGSFIYLVIIVCSSLILVPGDTLHLGALPLVQAFQTATGSFPLTLIMIFGILMGVTTTFNGFLLAGGKLLAAFSGAGFMAPSLGKTEANGIPRRALLVMAVLATLGMFLGKGLLAPLITMGGIAFLIAWFFMACATLRFNQKEPGALRPFRTPGGKLMIWLAIIVSAVLTLLMTLPGTLISLGVVENVLLVAWLLIGAAIYLVYRKTPIELKEIK